MMKKKYVPLVLTDQTKDIFIISSILKNIPYVISPFCIQNGNQVNTLHLHISRSWRAQELLQSLPSVFQMYSDGQSITIDGVYKLLNFSNENSSGIVQYHINDPKTLNGVEIDAIYEKLETSLEPIYIVTRPEDEARYIPNKLKVFPVTFFKGFAVCIADQIEKILYITINDSKTGFIGETQTYENNRMMAIQSLWPELNIEIIMKDYKLFAYSKLLEKELVQYSQNPMVIKCHKNFGGTDLKIEVTHIMK